MPLLGIGFNADKFTREFASRRARRLLKGFFDGIGNENLIFLISQNKNLVDYIPPDERYAYKSFMQPYGGYSRFFSDKDIYSWIPANWRDVIEEQPGGKEWASHQVSLIRAFLFPS